MNIQKLMADSVKTKLLDKIEKLRLIKEEEDRLNLQIDQITKSLDCEHLNIKTRSFHVATTYICEDCGHEYDYF